MAHKGYTLNYFIDFFSDIPTHRWTTGTLNAEGTVQCCALGHALAGPNPSADKLNNIESMDSNARVLALQNFLNDNVVAINDAHKGFGVLGKTPRGRILKALRNRKRTGNLWG